MIYGARKPIIVVIVWHFFFFAAYIPRLVHYQCRSGDYLFVGFCFSFENSI
jgi:hypothetical protein